MKTLKKAVDAALDSASFAAKYAVAGGFLWAGIYNAVSMMHAFQTASPVPSTTGTADSNNDSKSSPALTTSASNQFDRSTMSLEAVKNNFTTVLWDTSAIKTTANSVLTRVNGEACVSWLTPTTQACPSGWTYKTQSTVTVTTGCTIGKSTANGCSVAVTWSCWGSPYSCNGSVAFMTNATISCTTGTYYSVVCCK